MSGCPVCGAAPATPTHLELGFPYVRCGRCDLVRMDPLPTCKTQAERHLDYLPETRAGMRTFDLMSREVWARVRAALLRRFGQGRILDVGCGSGAFLAVMRTGGWEVNGVEVSSVGAGRTRSRGIPVHRGLVEDAPFPPASFHAVTAFYVIEHLPDPCGFLTACRRLLRPGGWLVLRFPDTTPLKDALARLGIANRLHNAPFHVLDFSPRAMRFALRRAGFSEARVRVGGFTIPVRIGDRALGVPSAAFGDLLDLATAGRVLLRGVSKTATAVRP